jgi:hypothetical protein
MDIAEDSKGGRALRMVLSAVALSHSLEVWRALDADVPQAGSGHVVSAIRIPGFLKTVDDIEYRYLE